MADVLYNKENTSVVLGELSGITETQVVGSIVSETLIESKGMSSESIKNLEVSAGEVSSLTKMILYVANQAVKYFSFALLIMCQQHQHF